ncbi:ATP-binding protein [Corynebacterium suedekumii]|uniref:ATP-binding protein n=1 Tax=Corynebacterium suedekumii TaxID=3049801 RepID=A0ABY8VI96_9CORY|nr:ATP-binding protein [Corynebacterium suedekumii]WIM69238.1 ATP-binding protein [Corynebacterium suedekumii]
MTTLTIQAGGDHIQRLSGQGSPEKALVELVWNALDAEATKVDVIVDRNDINGIDAITVKDNGHGFNSHEARGDFGNIGDSWKRKNTKTKNHMRALHGSKGQGRIRGFALGTEIHWDSIARAVAGGFERTTVKANSASLAQVTISSEALEGEHCETGTSFTAENKSQRTLPQLDSGEAKSELLESFAPLLIAEPDLVINYDGERLDPKSNIHDDKTLVVEFGNDDQTAQLRVIRWKAGKHRRILFGPTSEHFIEQLNDSEGYSSYAYTAYASSQVLNADNAKDLVLDAVEGSEAPLLHCKEAVLTTLHSYLRTKASEERERRVSDWKEKGVYPYEGTPKNRAEQTERAVFDTIAGAISDQIPRGKERAKLTLDLLKTSMQSDPDSLNRILSEVVSLSERDRQALDILLRETTLPNIIQSANTVSRRYKVLAGLEKLVLSGADSKPVKERQHLHMILENELWIFGEGYSTMTSERALTNLLREHLKLSGLPADSAEPVKTLEGKAGRTDLHFAVQNREHDRTRHLIVELKRPSVSATKEELSQVSNYGTAIAEDPAFRAGQSEWDIVLVVSNFGRGVLREITDKNTGMFNEYNEPGEPHVRMFVRSWATIIDENRRRLDFMNRSLKINPDSDEGLNYLKDLYPDYLPAEILQEGTNEVA